MIREVDLVSYLPPFIAEYKETNITLTAENPEFVLVWNATDKTLKNEFIATADEYGISRFEKIEIGRSGSIVVLDRFTGTMQIET